MERQYGEGVPRRRRDVILLRTLPFIYLAVALVAVIYFILGAGAAEIHSDSTDSLLWAEATLEAGRTLDPDFKYAGYVPFGSSIWAIPLLAIFGYGWASYKLTNLIFLLLFVLAAWLGFRSFELSHKRTAFAVGTLLMLCSASVKMREIFWGHVIYYSLAVLFLFLAIYLMEKKFFIPFILLSIGVAINGLQGISMFHFPLIAAILAITLIDRKRLRIYYLNVLGLTIPIGLGIKLFLERGGVSAGYASAYMTYSEEAKWLENVSILPRHIRTLFDATVAADVSLASVDSLSFVFRLALVLIICGLPIYLFLRWRHEDTALPLYTLAFLTAIILFTMIYGKLGSSSWRLTPVVIVGAFVGLGYLAQRAKEKFTVKTFLALFLGVFTLIQAGQIYAMPFDGWNDNALAPLQDALLDMDVEDTPIYGNFWVTHTLRLSSDDRLETRAVTFQEGDLKPYYYQVQGRFYLESATKDDFILVLRQHELAEAEEVLATLNSHIVHRRTIGGYHVFVGEGNLWDALDYDVVGHFDK